MSLDSERGKIATSPIDELYKKINEISPILRTMDASLLTEIDTIRNSVERLLANKERIEKLFSKETLSETECKFAQETVMSLMRILANQRAFSADTIKTLEKERNSVQTLQSDFSKLKEEAYIDPFTGLFNKFKFTEIFNSLLDLFNKEPESNNFSIACVEINDLIKIREEYGEETYDDLIKFFSYFLWKKLGKIGMVFHFHGNEFIFITKIISTELVKIVRKIAEDFFTMKNIKDIGALYSQERKGYLGAQIDSLESSLSLLLEVYGVSFNFSGGIIDYRQGLDEESFLTLVREKCYLAKNEGNGKILIG